MLREIQTELGNSALKFEFLESLSASRASSPAQLQSVLTVHGCRPGNAPLSLVSVKIEFLNETPLANLTPVRFMTDMFGNVCLHVLNSGVLSSALFAGQYLVELSCFQVSNVQSLKALVFFDSIVSTSLLLELPGLVLLLYAFFMLLPPSV